MTITVSDIDKAIERVKAEPSEESLRDLEDILTKAKRQEKKNEKPEKDSGEKKPDDEEKEAEESKGESSEEAGQESGSGGSGALDPDSEEEEKEFTDAVKDTTGAYKREATPSIEWHEAPLPDNEVFQKLKKLLQAAKTGVGTHVVKNLKHGGVNMRAAMSWKQTGNMRIFQKQIPGRIYQSTMAVAFVVDGSGSTSATDSDDLANSAAIACTAALADTGHIPYLCWYSSGAIIGDDISKIRGRPRKVNKQNGKTQLISQQYGGVDDWPQYTAPYVYKFLKTARAEAKFIILFTDGDILQTELDSWYLDQKIAGLDVVTYFIAFSSTYGDTFASLTLKPGDQNFEFSSMSGLAEIFGAILASNAAVLQAKIKKG